MPGLRRRPVHAARGGAATPRSCRSIPNTTRCSRRWRPARRSDVRAADPDGVRRPVPHLDARRRSRAATPEQALKHPNWSMGAQGHDRFRDPDEQGPGTDRGASPVPDAGAQHRCLCPPAIDRRTASSSSATARSSPSSARRTCVSRFRIASAWPDRIDEPARRLTARGNGEPDLRGAGSGSVSGPASARGRPSRRAARLRPS